MKVEHGMKMHTITLEEACAQGTTPSQIKAIADFHRRAAAPIKANKALRQEYENHKRMEAYFDAMADEMKALLQPAAS